VPVERLHPNDLRGRTCRWLLDLTFAGRTLRLSDDEVDVEQEDGTSLHYVGVLDAIEAEEGLDFLADASGSSTSVAIACVLPVDVPALVAAGHDLGAARAELSRWIEGTAYESRRRVISGGLSDPEYGASDEPVSFSIEASPWADSAEIPPPALTVTGSNWTDDMILSLATEDLGLYYPIVVGCPGKVSAAVASAGWVTGSQPVFVDHRNTAYAGVTPPAAGERIHITAVFAGHHVTATSVYLNTEEYTAGHRFRVLNTFDKQGHPVAILPWYVDRDNSDSDDFEYDSTVIYTFSSGTLHSLGSTPASIDNSFQPIAGESLPIYAGVLDEETEGGGGAIGPDGTTMRQAGDVLEFLLGYSNAPIDRGRFAAAKPLLSGFLFDFTIDGKTTPWEFIAQQLLPLLPVSLVVGPDGIYPIVWRWDAGVNDAVAHLSTAVDPSIERASNVSYDSDTILNDFTLKYALSIRTGTYMGKARLAGDEEDIDPDNLGDVTTGLIGYHARLSQLRYRNGDGSRLVVPETIETLAVYDDTTAQKILAWRSRAYAFARRRVEYLVPENVYGWLERGNVVTITDADLSWTQQVALVESVVTDGSGQIRLKLLLIEDPVRDARLVG
jgi:hypothetical protein